MNGKLVVIDGGDGSGKKTQTALLKEHLEKDGHPVVTIDFPQYEENNVGRLIKECLAGKHGDFLSLDPKIASILYAVDRFENKEQLESWLNEGKIIVSDRYISANMLHQGGKIGEEKVREDFFVWLDVLEHEIFGLPRPDLVVYCDVDFRKRLALLKAEAESSGVAVDVAEEDATHQAQADAAAKQLIGLYQWHTVSCMEGDNMRTPQEIHEDIYQQVKELL